VDLVIHLHSEGFERAYQALTLAVTARAMNQKVTIVLAFGALRALAEARLGEPLPGPDLWVQRRAGQMGVSTIDRLVADARSLSVELVACETVVQMTGIETEQLAGRASLISLPEIVRRQQGAQVIYV
jgi:peroxiredoxin family protein